MIAIQCHLSGDEEQTMHSSGSLYIESLYFPTEMTTPAIQYLNSLNIKYTLLDVTQDRLENETLCDAFARQLGVDCALVRPVCLHVVKY